MFDQNVLDRIQVITHSSIRIAGKTVIYIDPIGIAGEPHDADLILFTHPHFDHFSPKDVKKLMKADTVIAAPKSMALLCTLRLQKKPVTLLPGQQTELAGIPVTAVAAYNKAKPSHMKLMNWLGYLLTIGATQVYISGDTDVTEESKRCRSAVFIRWTPCRRRSLQTPLRRIRSFRCITASCSAARRHPNSSAMHCSRGFRPISVRQFTAM